MKTRGTAALVFAASWSACTGLVPTSTLVRTSQLIRAVSASSQEDETKQRPTIELEQSPFEIAASFLEKFRVKPSKRTHVLSKKAEKRTPEQLELLAAAADGRPSASTSSKISAAQAAAAAGASQAIDDASEAIGAADAEPSYQIATDLVNALVDTKRTPNKILRIESLLNRLTSSSIKHEYDPMEALFGPLFCTLYTYTPGEPNAKPPFWEQLSALSPTHATNIKGQQYYTKYDDQSQLCGSFINYSEIWGEHFHIRASGDFVPTDQPGDDDQKQSKGNQGGLMSTFFPKRKKAPSKSNMRTCPDIYKAQVTSASINILGQELKIPVSGSSYAVVLYADPRVRVFLKPASTTNGSSWENKGVIACQVRSDLISKGNAKLDLR